MMHDNHPTLGGKLLATLALGLLLTTALRRLRDVHGRRVGSKPGKLPRRLQTWEGEGGRPSDGVDHAPEVHPEPTPKSPGAQSLPH